MKMFLVGTETLPDIWHYVENPLRNIAERSSGKFELRDIASAILKGEFQLWVAVDDGGAFAALALTEVKQWPRKKVVQFVACVGKDRDDWLPHMDEIEGWAASLGATTEIIGRPGWARALKSRGYRETHRLLEKIA